MNNTLSELELHGFNNLTKSLCLCVYDISYQSSLVQQQTYHQKIDKNYGATQLTEILNNVTDIIGASVLNSAQQNYQPHGASATMMIAEGASPTSIVNHLNKSHICVHTYPENRPVNGISVFRADFEISTCGVISPLKALNYLLTCFNANVVTIDYRVRGFTRDVQGHKHFVDQPLSSIQEYLSTELTKKYQITDINNDSLNLYFTKMKKLTVDLEGVIFSLSKDKITQEQLFRLINKEQNEIFL